MKPTTSNCNYHLTHLYKERDAIGASIDKAICDGKLETVAELEKEHEDICSIINTFLEFRRKNDCLLEGDPGYGPM